jgi:hypothetical protein
MIANSIGVFRNAMSPEWCAELCARFDEKEARARSEWQTQNGRTGDPPNNYDDGGIIWRNCEKRIDISANLSVFTSIHPMVRDMERMLELNSTTYFRWFSQRQYEYDGNEPDRAREGFDPQRQNMVYKMQKTYAGGGFCQWHYEQGREPGTVERYGVWMLYLNDVANGGRTDFPAQNVSFAPECGTLVIWPAAYTHPHRGAPDLRQTKYIVTGWFEHLPKGTQ